MASSLVKEISGVRAFFQARSAMSSKDEDSTLQKSFADTLITMINNVKSLGPVEATMIVDALKDDPYGPEHTRRISTIIDGKVQASGRTAHKSDGTSSKQVLKDWWNYFTDSDWSVLNDPKASFYRKLTAIVERGISVGCDDPEEQTYKWALATLLIVHYDELPEPKQLYDKLQEVKAAFAAEKKGLGFVRIQQFPEFPSDLPGDIFQSAYAVEKPNARILKGIIAIAEAIPLRSNSKKMKKGKCVAAAKGLLEAKHGLGESHSAGAPAPHQDTASGSGRLGTIVASPEDPYEMRLFYEYQQKLIEHRRANRQPDGASPLASGAQSGARPQDALRIRRASDGSLTAKPELDTEGPPVKAEKKDELAAPVEAVQLAGGKDAAEDGSGSEDDLDEYTKAAIKSLQLRRDKRKEETKAKAKAKAAAKKAEKAKVKLEAEAAAAAAGSGSASKRGKRRATADACNEPAKAVKTEDALKPVPKSKILDAMPSLPKDGSNPPPVAYKQGIIYTSVKTKRFRALKTRGDAYSEFSRGWGGPKPNKEAWASAVQAIEKSKPK